MRFARAILWLVLCVMISVCWAKDMSSSRLIISSTKGAQEYNVAPNVLVKTRILVCGYKIFAA